MILCLWLKVGKCRLQTGRSSVVFNWKTTGKRVSNTVGAKLDDVGASEMLEKIEDEFNPTIMLFTDFNGNPVWKILDVQMANKSIYTVMYPDSSSGFAWTIEFIFATQNANQWSDISSGQKFKIRFDY